MPKRGARNSKKNFFQRHDLSLVCGAILIVWIALFSRSEGKGHLDSFFGNAIADWTGVVVMILATKYLYERGSAESKKAKAERGGKLFELLREHSLTLFLLLTGAAWVLLYAHMDSESKWGGVVGNVVSEWTQLLGSVLLTKRLIEAGSKESR